MALHIYSRAAWKKGKQKYLSVLTPFSSGHGLLIVSIYIGFWDKDFIISNCQHTFSGNMKEPLLWFMATICVCICKYINIYT